MSDLAAIQKRDNESGNVWFTGPASFTAKLRETDAIY